MEDLEEMLGQLNAAQREAVTYTDGPQLVIAGAGSGKTRVLTYKVAYLLKLGVRPWEILALTFTNKAAREMKERIAKLTDANTTRRLWMGTFHSIFSRILRSEASSIGFPSDFTIYDSADTKSLQHTILKEMQLDDKVYRPGLVQNRISNAKNALITCESYASNSELITYDRQCRVPLIAEIYKRYQQRCRQAGAMDFDDLLLQTNLLFRDHPEVLGKYQQFFRYILVDEYQDTNFAQHLIVQRLAELHNRICVVGDDAQSIYSFRGANIDNILQFKQRFPGCRLYKLERNYRSTQNIVAAANSLIHKNTQQIEKVVYSEKEEGSLLSVFQALTDYEEVYAVVGKIISLSRQHHSYADMAVLYRTNAQSRIIEDAMRKRSVPYRIYGGLSFYQRKEVKDVISYLRLLINPHDEEALKRVINYPTRGIGATSVTRLTAAAVQHNVSLWTVIGDPIGYALPVNAGTAKKLQAFRALVEDFITQNETMSADEIAAYVVKKSGLAAELYGDRSVEGVNKEENVKELLKGIVEFCELRREEGDGDSRVPLTDFLAEIALLTDQDNDKDEHSDKVTLMTVHAAKGLEFRNVFVVGMEEDLFPSSQSKESPRALEEERRLFYVAITRAEENCFLSYAKSRFRNGKSTLCSPSRFLRDIDSRYLSVVSDDFEDSSRSRYGEAVISAKSDYREPTYRKPQFEQSTLDTPSVSRFKRLQPTAEPTLPQETYASPRSLGGYSVGQRVAHDRFGEGRIVAFEGDGADAKAIVDFLHLGSKKLLLRFAKMKIL